MPYNGVTLHKAGMRIKGLEKWEIDWWKALAKRSGFMYRGSPSVRGLMSAIAKGEYSIVKNKVAETD